MTRPNGITTNYTYDSLSRLLSVLHQSGTTTLDGASYTLDNAGNRTAKTDQRTAVATSYGYDSIYQLLSATQGTNTTESYSYDAVGNRTASLGVSPYSYNTSNELTSTPSATYTYDDDGNTTSKTDSTGTTSYSWDYENRLTSVTLPGSGGTVSFKYDPFGRRICKSSSAATSIFAYDGQNLIEETNSAGSVIARYAQTTKLDQPVAMLRSNTTSYYQADRLGSVTSLSSSTGSLAQTYGYDAFGQETSSSGSLTNPFQYTARELDPETNLYFYRARYFDLGPGRFISEDPIRFRGGINFYAYVRNNPSTFTDAKGLGRGQVPSPDPFWPIQWCQCELAGPREPLTGGLCLYLCDCDDGNPDKTVYFPMWGMFGLRSMCGAKLSCPWEVYAIRINIFGGMSSWAPYVGKP